MTRKTYHHGNLREALLDIANQQLARKGHADISLRELARMAGVSPNAAYRHFADKEALLAALAAGGFTRMATEQGKAVAAHQDPMQRHRAAGRTYVRFARDHPALFRLMFGRQFRKDAALDSSSTLAFDALRAGAAAALGLPLDDARALTAAIRAWSLAHGLSQLILDGQLAEFEGELDRLIDSVLQPPENVRAAARRVAAGAPKRRRR
ncbi:MAG TPA: TetR/AcrR family transcriptional regulator [Candidatus Binatia bacterium]|nr:TetR/AcrR family transcriptional regulator [Candidatus Binatia bacterium]